MPINPRLMAPFRKVSALVAQWFLCTIAGELLYTIGNEPLRTIQDA